MTQIPAVRRRPATSDWRVGHVQVPDRPASILIGWWTAALLIATAIDLACLFGLGWIVEAFR